MSTHYKKGSEVPLQILINRLDEISTIITEGKAESLTMSIPAEIDHDADLVLAECVRRLEAVERTHIEASESKNFW